MKSIGHIKKKDLRPWLDSLSEAYKVFLPVQDTVEARIDFMDYRDFLALESGSEADRYVINLAEKTRLSPKFVFFQPSEGLFGFEYKKKTEDPKNVTTDIMISEPESGGLPILLFGVKPCDVAGLKRLDIFYSGGLKKDTPYLNRRKDSLIISIGCSHPFPDCFCTSVDGHPFDFEDADIAMVETESGYLMVKANEKGRSLLDKSNRSIDKDPSVKDYEADAERLVSESEQKLKEYWKGIGKNEISRMMDNSMDTGLWEEITAKCISCAACTYACPTCFCFNIRDEQNGLKGERYRCWDYCMNSYYTLEASGHNPRADKSKRYRNKVNCKYNYNIKRNNNYYCVGCGRCIEICPVSVDIRKVVDRVIKNGNETPVK